MKFLAGKKREGVSESAVQDRGSTDVFRKKITERADQLGQSVLRLNYIAESSNAAIKAAKGSIMEIDDSNRKLMENIGEVQGLSGDIEGRIEENLQYTASLVQAAEEMTESNEQLGGIFENLMADNGKTSVGIEEIAENIRAVVVATEEILKATASINAIAQKTNLLSLNASIEAARAGEAGRGFAVVATEISSLAEVSRKSAENIGTIVQRLKEQSELSVNSVATIRESFGRQTDHMLTTRALLENTGKKIDEVQENVKLVDENMDTLEQCKNIIVEDMQKLSKLGRDNAEATSMIVTDFKSVVKNTSDMAKLAYELNGVSDDLHYATRDFAGNAAANTGEKTVMRVGYMPNYGSLCSIAAAIKLGYFEKENIQPELIEFANGMQIIDALKDGRLDVGYIGHGAHKRCIAGDAVIFLLSHISNAEAIIGSRKKDVRTLQHLRGKRIGTSVGNTSDALLDIALESEGISRAECEIVDLPPEEIVKEMQAGRLDACALWSPYSLELLKKGGNDMTLLANNLTYSNRLASLSSWITTPEFAREQSQKLLRFTKALYGGMNYRALEDNMKQVASWVSEMTGMNAGSAYEQRFDADWSSAGYIVIGVQDGTIERLYEAQQKQFLSAGNIKTMVPVKSYVLLDNMVEAIR